MKNEKKFEAFKAGVIDALNAIKPDREREYDSDFWGNVHASDFASRSIVEAYEAGQEVVEFACQDCE